MHPSNDKTIVDQRGNREHVRRLIVCRNLDELAASGSALIAGFARETMQNRDRFTVALAGGATPQKTYSALAECGEAAGIDWSRTYFFFGDERFVPLDDPRSNFAMVERTLLRRRPIARSHALAIPTDRPNAAEAAAAYASQLAEFFASPSSGPPPRLDLAILGLGTDGHTASLFPAAPALREQQAWVTWSAPGTLPPPVERITMTYPILNAARQVLFLVAGDEKAIALRDAFQGDVPVERCPAAGIRPMEGSVTWLADEPAARLLTR